MTKKNYVAIIVAMVMAIGFLSAVTYYGAQQAFDKEAIKRGEEILERVAARTGYINLGVIDQVAVSKEHGCLWNGQAVMEELFSRNGLETPTNSWMTWIDDEDYVSVIKITEFVGEQTQPIFDQEVKTIYIAGLY